MSYALVPYLVDLNELRHAVGSNDRTLLEAIFQQDPERFSAEEAVDVVDHEADAEVTLRRALQDLVLGEPRDQQAAHQYGYALEQLCGHFGKRLDAEMWEDIRWEVLEETGFEQIINQTGSPVPLPPINDFPSIGHLTPEQTREIVSKMGSGHLKTAAPSGRKPRPSFRSWLLRLLMSRITRRGKLTDEDLRELLDEYESWLREAASKNQALVFFYY